MSLAEEFARLTRPFPEPHLLVTRAGEILARNAAAGRLLASNPTPPETLYDLGHESAEQITSLLRRASRSGDFVPGSLSIARADGELVRYRCDGAVLPSDPPGPDDLILLRLHALTGASHVFPLLNQKIEELAREIHERQRVENELQAQTLALEENAAELEAIVEELELQKDAAQRANRAKSEFLAVMSHELRTPLNAIVGYTDLLEAEVKGPLLPEQRGQVERIKRSSLHLIAIIEEILAFSRLEAGRETTDLVPADLAQIAREAAELVEPAALEHGLSIRMRLPNEPALLETDPAKVRQILVNLLSNAVKFTESGSITVSIEGDDLAYRIAVSDTGIGILEEDLERIFEPFWQVSRGTTRRAGGTGLGLTVTRKLARLLGGDVTAQSVHQRGSTFVVHLPRVPVVAADGSSASYAPRT